jgi:hypothetical protein
VRWVATSGNGTCCVLCDGVPHRNQRCFVRLCGCVCVCMHVAGCAFFRASNRRQPTATGCESACRGRTWLAQRWRSTSPSAPWRCGVGQTGGKRCATAGWATLTACPPTWCARPTTCCRCVSASRLDDCDESLGWLALRFTAACVLCVCLLPVACGLPAVRRLALLSLAPEK